LDAVQGDSEERSVAVFKIRLMSTGAGNAAMRQDTSYLLIVVPGQAAHVGL